MHRRLRWGNVARAAGAATIVALVVAWPRLAPPQPALPGSDVAPLGDAPITERDEHRARRRTERTRRRGGRERRGPTERRRARTVRRDETWRQTAPAGARPKRDIVGSGQPAGADAPDGTDAPAEAPSVDEARARVPDAAEVEFGFERAP